MWHRRVLPARLRGSRFGAGNDGVGLRRAVKLGDAGNVASLQLAEALLVAVADDLARAVGMIEPERVADLVGEGVAQIVDVEIAVKANLPTLGGIEADQGAVRSA